jgi:hypothetical protein
MRFLGEFFEGVKKYYNLKEIKRVEDFSIKLWKFIFEISIDKYGK